MNDAVDVFSHIDESLHDAEIEIEAPNALCLLLGYILSLSFRVGDGGPRVKTITTKRASKCAVPPFFLDETPFSFFRLGVITAITPGE